MLFKDYNARITAKEAVKHKWIVTYAIGGDDKKDIKRALHMFRGYINKGPLQIACMDFIIRNLIA